MGVWALDVFGNDAAADLGFELEDAPSNDAVIEILRARLATVISGSSGRVSPSDYDEAIAAAALVIAVDDASVLPDSAEHYGPQPWPPAGLIVPEDVRQLGLKALDRALDPLDNEWFDVSDEAGIWPEQSAKVQDLRSRLNDV